ncbi:MAG: hypothetical protein M1828_001364 [Chrysothrix sp. TS-e1954]|nr:MAG: hypothetical protein M1828_001364 [Chrysothrix sp. TS-e1954]
MSNIRFGTNDLLEYCPGYSILICRECHYAIQKSALESHLLKHKIYRGDRQRLLSSINQFDLLEPHLVPLPAPGLTPVSDLPVVSGYRCTESGCRHLTASSKRMQRHWSESHGFGGAIPLPSSFAHPVKLQTFFRGTKVRYFEVASNAATLTTHGDDGNERDNNDGGDDRQEYDGRDYEADVAISRPPMRTSTSNEVTQYRSVPSFDRQDMSYFSHFMTKTSLTLPGAKGQWFAKQYWQTDIVSQAVQRRWLMCGLLSMSAFHSATLAHDPTTRQAHYERGSQYSTDFFAHLEQMATSESLSEANEHLKETKGAGEHIKYLLCCALWTMAISAIDYQSVSPC